MKMTNIWGGKNSLFTVLCRRGFGDLLPALVALPVWDGVHLRWGGVHAVSRFVLAHSCSR